MFVGIPLDEDVAVLHGERGTHAQRTRPAAVRRDVRWRAQRAQAHALWVKPAGGVLAVPSIRLGGALVIARNPQTRLVVGRVAHAMIAVLHLAATDLLERFRQRRRLEAPRPQRPYGSVYLGIVHHSSEHLTCLHRRVDISRRAVSAKAREPRRGARPLLRARRERHAVRNGAARTSLRTSRALHLRVLGLPYLDQAGTRVFALVRRITASGAGDGEQRAWVRLREALRSPRASSPSHAPVRTTAVCVQRVVGKEQCDVPQRGRLVHREHSEVHLAWLAGAVAARVDDALVEQRTQLIPCVTTDHRPHVVHVKVCDPIKLVVHFDESL